MTDAHVQPGNPATTGDERATVLLVYVLYFCALLSCGLAGIAGVIIAYIKRGDANIPLWESHFDGQITTFWTWCAIALAGIVTLPVLIGVPILFFAFVYFLYRTIKGFLRALEYRTYA
ncbi:MAG: hypothetical protein JOZ55_02070 [Alphaproteobacteria bacterium]|nr:hypothetical protein [Alphaproteobacteria bacterium]